MRRPNPWKLSTLVLAATIVLVAGDGFVSEADAKPSSALLQALGALEAARGALFRVKADEAGHRAKAIAATRAAVMELRQAAFGKEGAKQFEGAKQLK